MTKTGICDECGRTMSNIQVALAGETCSQCMIAQDERRRNND